MTNTNFTLYEVSTVTYGVLAKRVIMGQLSHWGIIQSCVTGGGNLLSIGLFPVVLKHYAIHSPITRMNENLDSP